MTSSARPCGAPQRPKKMGSKWVETNSEGLMIDDGLYVECWYYVMLILMLIWMLILVKMLNWNCLITTMLNMLRDSQGWVNTGCSRTGCRLTLFKHRDSVTRQDVMVGEASQAAVSHPFSIYSSWYPYLIGDFVNFFPTCFWHLGWLQIWVLCFNWAPTRYPFDSIWCLQVIVKLLEEGEKANLNSMVEVFRSWSYNLSLVFVESQQ